MQTMFSKISSYFKERFPIGPLALYSGLTIFGIANKIQTQVNYFNVFALFFIYLGFLLHLRILDEFKDYNYDSIHHQGRPVQRGFVSLTFLKYIGVANFFFMVALGFFISPLLIFAIFLFAMSYTYLMFNEFFIKKFHEKSAFLYLISHQIIFLPLFYFFFSVLNKGLFKLNDQSSVALFIFSILPIVIIEIGRKMNHRIDHRGKKTNDTYAYVWGERTSICIFALFIIIEGVLSFFIIGFLKSLSFSIILIGFFLFAGLYKHHRIIMSYHMAITTIVGLFLPFSLLLE